MPLCRTLEEMRALHAPPVSRHDACPTSVVTTVTTTTTTTTTTAAHPHPVREHGLCIREAGCLFYPHPHSCQSIRPRELWCSHCTNHFLFAEHACSHN